MRGAHVLSAVPLFSGLPTRDLRRIADLAREVRVGEGSTVVEEEPGDTFYVILEGEARVTRGGRTINRLLPGDFFGEVSLLDGGPRTATVVAETPLVLLALSRGPFRRMLEREPTVTLRILKEVAGRLRSTERPLTG